MRTLLFLAFFIISASTTVAQPTYLHCGRLIDGIRDDVATEMTLVIEDGTISQVEEGFTSPPANATAIDLREHTCLPGLMDMHVHMESQTSPDNYMKRFTLNPADVAFNAQGYAETTLMSGFTTVRDVGGSGVNIALRNAINAGKVAGPRMFTAGKTIGTTGGHADPTNSYSNELMGDPGPKEGVINGPIEARKAVRQRYKNGADLIKITATGGVLSMAASGTAAQFTMDELEAIVSTASDYGFHVAAHAHGVEGMQRAIKAGVTTIEHGTYMDDETMALMKEYGTYYVPTIIAGKSVADSAKIDGYYPPIVQPKAEAIGPKIQDTFARAYESGVNIAFGTDAGVFGHGKNAIEFSYMTEAGMPAMEAIKVATMVPAQILGISESLGSIETGKTADIIAVPGNPIDDITTLQTVDFVMKEGHIYKQ